MGLFSNHSMLLRVSSSCELKQWLALSGPHNNIPSIDFHVGNPID